MNTHSDEKLDQIKNAVIEWMGKQGHDSCHYYPDIFNKIAAILDIEPINQNLPPLEEFKEFCKRHQNEVYNLGEQPNGSAAKS